MRGFPSRRFLRASQHSRLTGVVDEAAEEVHEGDDAADEAEDDGRERRGRELCTVCVRARGDGACVEVVLELEWRGGGGELGW